MARPLDGIRVIEIGNYIAAPLCGMLLADMGADVIKVEAPKAGDLSRAFPPMVNGESAAFATLNRNKRSLVLDLKQPAGQKVVLELAAKSDILIENNRPGALEKLGLGAEHVRAVNPTIAYVSVSGYGQTGPYRRRAGTNFTIEAFAGSLSITGEPNDMPMRSGIQVSDITGALVATYSALCGLVNAMRNKDGRSFDVSLSDATIAVAVWETSQYLTTGEVPRRLGHRHRVNTPAQLFEAKGGRYLSINAGNDNHFQRLMKVLGLERYGTDPRFVTKKVRKQNEDALLALICPVILTWNAEDLDTKLAEVGVACSPVNNYEQVFAHPQIQERKVLVDVEHPRIGKMKAVRNPVLVDKDGPAIRRPAPILGEHTEEILESLGYTKERIEALGSAGVLGAAWSK